MVEILGVILLILLIMISYSSGITVVAKRRDYSPGVIDLIVVFGLWVVVLGIRPQMPRPPLLIIVIGLGMLVGILIAAFRYSRSNQAIIIPKSELPEHAQEISSIEAIPDHWLKKLWHRWSNFAGRMGNVQSRLLMGFFYFFIVTPFGLITRVFSDPLTLKKIPQKSNWQAKEMTQLTIEAAQEQG